MTTEEKIAYVTETLIPMLRNDMRVVTEIRCPKHGREDTSAPNFTAAFICLAACEVIGNLSAAPGIRGFDATKAFIVSVGDWVGASRYREVAGPLFAFFRHGIGHGFLPKLHRGIHGAAFWMTDVCVDDLQTGARASDARARHLHVAKIAHTVTFQVFPQVLFVDVDRTIAEFAESLRNGTFDRDLFSKNFDRWRDDNERVGDSYLTPSEMAALGMVSPPIDGKGRRR